MSVDRNLAEIAAAARAKLDARAADDAAIARMEAALCRLIIEDGVVMARVPELTARYLTERGFGPEQVDRLGISYGSVRRAMDRRRRT